MQALCDVLHDGRGSGFSKVLKFPEKLVLPKRHVGPGKPQNVATSNWMKRVSRKYRRKFLKIMVAPGRVELPTFGLGNRCSIHLSYGANAT